MKKNSNRLVAWVTRLGGEQNVKGDAGSSKRSMMMDQSLVDVPVEYRTRTEFHAITWLQWLNPDALKGWHQQTQCHSGEPQNAWKWQYPEEVEVSCNFDLSTLRRTPEDRLMRYCPPYTAPSKVGRPKNEKRMKSPVEGTKKRRRSQD